MGEWQTDLVQWDNPTGHTNKIAGFSKMEFLTNGVFKLACFVKTVTGQVIPVPVTYDGQYQVIDVSHIKVEVSKNMAAVFGASGRTLSYSVSGDTLDLPGLSDITQTKIYHRVSH